VIGGRFYAAAAAVCSLVLLAAARPLPHDGSRPMGLVDGGDAIYGTASSGGPHCLPDSSAPVSMVRNPGCGVVFRIEYDGSGFRIIYAFDDASDGGHPVTPPLLGSDGALYGASSGEGADGHSVVYTLHRDGTHFRVLYAYPAGAADPPLAAVTAGGTLYAAVPAGKPSNADARIANRAVAAIANGTVTIVHDFEKPILNLRADGNVVYALVETGPGTNALFSIEASGAVRRLLPDMAQDKFGAYLRSPVAFKGSVYAIAGFSIVRIHDGTLTELRAFPRLDPAGSLGRDGALLPNIAMSRDGNVVGETSQLRDLNCGTVFSLGPTHAYTLLGTLPKTGAGLCLGDDFGLINGSPPIVAHNGTIYGSSPGQVFCGMSGFCGGVFSIDRGIVRVIHMFAVATPVPQTAPGPTEAPSYVSAPTGIPRRFALRLTTSAGAVFTPSPRPFALVSVDRHAVIPLRLVGPTSGTVLTYESPKLPAGLYRSIVGGLPADSFYLAPEPDATPALAPGQRFLALPGIVENATSDAFGNAPGTTPLTLIARKSGALRFRVGESNDTFWVASSARSATTVAGMTPIVEDASALQSAQRYIGRTVYPTADFAGLCVGSTGSVDAGSGGGFTPQALRVSSVFRLYGVVTTINLDANPVDDAAQLTVVNPLVFGFAAPMPHDIFGMPGSRCVALYAVIADPWQIERTMSLHPLIDPTWPARYRKAIAAGNVLPGMTYDMVVASIGYPSAFGTVAHLKSLTDWSYERPAPFGADVYFKNGFVTKYDPPGELP
jgi:hypothetical protein